MSDNKVVLEEGLKVSQVLTRDMDLHGQLQGKGVNELIYPLSVSSSCYSVCNRLLRSPQGKV